MATFHVDESATPIKTRADDPITKFAAALSIGGREHG
jgi:hypothetical protein